MNARQLRFWRGTKKYEMQTGKKVAQKIRNANCKKVAQKIRNANWKKLAIKNKKCKLEKSCQRER